MANRRLKEAENQPTVTEDVVPGMDSPWNEHRDDATNGAAGPTSPRLTPVDIQQKEFRLAFRGYNEHEVDAFLDQVTVELARLYEENRRPLFRVEFLLPDGKLLARDWTRRELPSPDWLARPPDWLASPSRSWPRPQDPITFKGQVLPGHEAEARALLDAPVPE